MNAQADDNFNNRWPESNTARNNTRHSLRDDRDLGGTGGNHPDDTWKNAYYLSTTMDARKY